ncbi:amino acid adenylation domain-containing protein [Corynebacterium sp. TAE3-ERU2]|uniref:amino acid adenylation domain-containing protein n=1 Tax=Corynebacterium sp. TAE3-ERU2 TaxID=2849497 RepID=UPI001C478C68|nr:amino acid adenylation domain-containing protein [Corynebacterium sp. TAE3-ERU2]MBV7301790.1 amino acid adenylation domain-containing protein [Corynebacterium sp. TAE3-ERU2]
MNSPIGNVAHYGLRSLLTVLDSAHLTEDVGTLPNPELVTLRDCGVTSFQALKIQQTLREDLGIQVPLSELLGTLTLGELARRYHPQMGAGSSAQGQAEDSSPPSRSADAAEEMPLTALQTAYWVGRSPEFELGGVGSHWFNEYILDIDAITRSPAARYLLDDAPDTTPAELAIEVLDVAFRRVLAAEITLRSAVTAEGRLREAVIDCRDCRIERVDLRASDQHTAQERMTMLRRSHSHLVFDPMRWPMFAITAVLLPDHSVHLLLSTDAVLLDYASFTALLTRWKEAVYMPFSEMSAHDTFRQPSPLPESHDAQAWWKKQKLNPPPTLAVAPQDAANTTTRYQRRIDGKTWARIVEQCERHHVSPTGLLLTVYAVLLDRFRVNDEDFSINLTVYDRPPGQSDVIGDFSSNAICDVPRLNYTVPAERTITNITDRLWECVDHRAYPASAERKRRKLHEQASPFSATDPIVFTSTLGVGTTDAEEWLGNKQLGLSQTPQVLVDHLVFTAGDDLVLVWDVRDGEWPEDMWTSFADSSLRALSQFATSDAWERPSLGWMPFHIEMDAPADAGIPEDDGLLHTPWMRAAKRYPERPAVITPSATVTHRELEERVSALRTTLDTQVTAGDRVIIAMPKSAAQVVSALAVCASGAAYVPVDPAWPAARIEAVVKRATPSTILTLSDESEALRALAETYSLSQITLRHDGTLDTSCAPAPKEEHSLAPASSHTCPDDLAYIIFTSGSTGEPKGVAIEHRQARVTIDDVNDRFAITAEDSVLGVSSLSFDLSVYDVFGMLGVGGCVILPDPHQAIDPTYLATLIEKHGITVWNSAPATFELVIDALETAPQPPSIRSLRHVLLSGDWLPITLPTRMWSLSPYTYIHSLGGATEAAIWSITYPITAVHESWTSIPYGRALRGQEFLVLDEDGLPCRVDQPGELHIGGHGVARGYLADEEKTNDRFIIHPVLQRRFYRTGDIGKWRSDSTIEFLGRNDRQVKINGYRIELGDVEAALQRMPNVRGAVVTAVRGPDNRQRLIAYVAQHDNSAASDYYQQLKDSLPNYMVPHRIVTLEALPLTDNGKVDFSALPDPFSTSRKKNTAPTQHSSTGEVATESEKESPAPAESNLSTATAVDSAAHHAPRPISTAEETEEQSESPAFADAVHAFISARTDQEHWKNLPLLALGFDSVSLVQLALLIEEHTGTRPSLTTLTKAETTGALLESLRSTSSETDATVPEDAPRPRHSADTPVQQPSTMDSRPERRGLYSPSSNSEHVEEGTQRGQTGEPLSVRMHRIADALARIEECASAVDQLEQLLGLKSAENPQTSHRTACTPAPQSTMAELVNVDDAALDANGGTTPPSTARVDDHDADHCDVPFNEMQLAYFIGRHTPFYGAKTAAHYYTELHCSELDPQRLQAACTRTVDVFDCLKLYATSNATARRDPDAGIDVATLDLSDLSESEQQHRLSEIREERATRVLDSGHAPLIEVLAIHTGHRQWRVIVDVDLLFFDAPTALRITRVIEQEYLQPGCTREWDRVPLPAAAAPIRQAEPGAPIAPSPALPLTAVGAASEPTDPHHPAGNHHCWHRLRHVVPAHLASALEEDAMHHSASLTQYIIWCVAQTLSPEEDCSLIVTTNPAAITDPDGPAGELTHTAVLTVPCSQGEAAAKAALHTQYWESMDARINAPHGMAHGNDQLRAARNAGAAMPVVSVSSALGSAPGDASQLLTALGETVYAISQTPGMLLDVQAFRTEEQGDLVINWDFDSTVVDAAALSRLFDSFLSLLNHSHITPESTHSDTSAQRHPDSAAIRELVHSTLSDTASLEDLDPQRPFFEQSITSLDLVAAQQRLHAQGMNVTVVDLLSNPTVDALVAKIVDSSSASEPSTTPDARRLVADTLSNHTVTVDSPTRAARGTEQAPRRESLSRRARGHRRAAILANYREE